MTTPITIRMPNKILKHYKDKAEKTGMPYQSLIKAAISESVCSEIAVNQEAQNAKA